MLRRQSQLPILPHVPIHSSLRFSTVHWPPLARWFFLHRRNQQHHNLPGIPHRHQDHHPCRLFMFGCWVLPAQQLLQGAAVRQLFQHGQWHLPGPHHLPGHKAWEPLYSRDSGRGRESKSTTQVCLSHDQPDSKWLQVLARLYHYFGRKHLYNCRFIRCGQAEHTWCKRAIRG